MSSFMKKYTIVFAFLLALPLLARPGKQKKKHIKAVAAKLFEYTGRSNFRYRNSNEYADFGVKLPDGSYQFHGILLDTGALNMLYLYKIKGQEVHSLRIYLKQRALKDHSRRWTRIRGRMRGPGRWDKLELDVIEFKKDLEYQKNFHKKLHTPLKSICTKTRYYRTGFDLNFFKRGGALSGPRFRKARKKNLNRLPLQKRRQIVYYDHFAQKMGVDCGRVEVYRDIQLGIFLNYRAGYDLSSGKLEKVYVVHTGYFLE